MPPAVTNAIKTKNSYSRINPAYVLMDFIYIRFTTNAKLVPPSILDVLNATMTEIHVSSVTWKTLFTMLKPKIVNANQTITHLQALNANSAAHQ